MRGVKKDQNMGHYPDELIHYICEACHNLRFRSENLLSPYIECLLKAKMDQFKHMYYFIIRGPLKKKNTNLGFWLNLGGTQAYQH